ncbi:MAG: class I SAM-dependent methyltransferase [Clostridia bacterium]|nr:class I SAM-dependent methyltransferase [Clostridia bacterium]
MSKTIKTLIDYYNDFAEAWAERWYPNEELLPYLKQFVKLLPKNARVLDLCCGAGYESMRLNNLGINVVGVDLSEKSIEIAKQHNPTIDFHVKDMLKSYKDLGVFDGIACIAGLVHLPEYQLELAFKNMHEVLKDNSYLFIVVRNGDRITKSIEVEGQEYAREFYCYTLDKIKQHSEKYFQFVEELEQNEDWRYYILKKV